MLRLVPLALAIGLVGACKRDSDDETERRAVVQSLPYLSSKVDSESKEGVTVHDPERAHPGLNLYADTERREAYLAEMDGTIVHTWKTDIDGISHVELRPNGHIIASLFNGQRDTGLVELDWKSRVVWHRRDRCHHDVDIAEDGKIYTLCRRARFVKHGSEEFPILDEYLTVLEPDGSLAREVSLYSIVGERIEDRFKKRIAELWKSRHQKLAKRYASPSEWPFLHMNSPYDVFHTNTVEIVREDIEGIAKKGQILTSFRHLDLVAIIDLEDEKLVWSWGPGEVQMQHTPTFLTNHNLLIFDNGPLRKHSRVIELDPRSKTIVWEYKADPPTAFFTNGRGSAQRLPNGNTLIAESDSGRVFEVTRDGDIVWELYTRKRGKERPLIYRWLRVAHSSVEPLAGSK